MGDGAFDGRMGALVSEAVLLTVIAAVSSFVFPSEGSARVIPLATTAPSGIGLMGGLGAAGCTLF
jgi:hypothetical protein